MRFEVVEPTLQLPGSPLVSHGLAEFPESVRRGDIVSLLSSGSLLVRAVIGRVFFGSDDIAQAPLLIVKGVNRRDREQLESFIQGNDNG